MFLQQIVACKTVSKWGLVEIKVDWFVWLLEGNLAVHRQYFRIEIIKLLLFNKGGAEIQAENINTAIFTLSLLYQFEDFLKQ